MRKLLISFLVFLVAVAVVAYYMYNKPVESLSAKKAEYSLQADTLFTAFEQDEEKANKLYLNKVLEVSGKVQSVNTDTSGLSLTLQTSSGLFGVICKLEQGTESSAQYNVGDEVNLKGLCTGYLMDVILIKCVPADDNS